MTKYPTATVILTWKSDHNASVRFDAAKPEPGQPPAAVQNVYVSRSFAAINGAKKIQVTVEVLE